jgi:hypothetical protein
MPFSRDDLTTGSHYEIAIELSVRADERRLREAVATLWKSGLVEGPWLSIEEIGVGPTVPLDQLSLEESWAYGLIVGEKPLACVMHCIRESGGSDWLDVSVSSPILESVLGIKDLSELDDDPRLEPVDESFAKIADRIYSAVPFELALIGEEVSGTAYARSLARGVCAFSQVSVLCSQRLKDELPFSAEFRRRDSGLWWNRRFRPGG